MKYTKQLLNMTDKLMLHGLNVKYIDAGFIVNGLYIETSSETNIYKDGKLLKTFKSPKGAIKFLLK